MAHLFVITGYFNEMIQSYTIYKCAFVSTYNWYIKGHNWEIFSWDIRDDATVPCRHEAWRPVNCLPAKACNVLGVCTFNGLV